MTILVDTGVLVALVDPDTREHIWIRTCQHVDGWTDVHKWPAPASAPRSTKRGNPKPETKHADDNHRWTQMNTDSEGSFK